MGTPVIVKMLSLALRIYPPEDSRVGSSAVRFRVVNLNKTKIRITFGRTVREVQRNYSRSDFYVHSGKVRHITFYTYDLDENCKIIGEYARITIFRDKSNRLSYTITMGRLVDLVAKGEISCSHMW